MLPALRKCESECEVQSTTYCFSLSYEMMGQCWEREPEKRLTFSELVTVISSSLEDMSGYLDLTIPSLTAEHILSNDVDDIEN